MGRMITSVEDRMYAMMEDPGRRHVILGISDYEGPMTYNDLRTTLKIKDEEMRRAVDELESSGFMCFVDPTLMTRVNDDMRYHHTSMIKWDQVWAQSCVEFYKINSMFFE